MDGIAFEDKRIGQAAGIGKTVAEATVMPRSRA